jgi:hypothetical protein
MSVVQTLPSGGQSEPEGAAVMVPSSQNPAPEWPDPGAGPQRAPTAQGLPLSHAWVPLVPHCVQFPPPQYHPTAHCWFRAQAVLVNRAVQAPAPVLSFRLQYCEGELHRPSLPSGLVLVAPATLQPAHVPALQNPEAQSVACKHAEPLATSAACTVAMVFATWPTGTGSSCRLHAESANAMNESTMAPERAVRERGFVAIPTPRRLDGGTSSACPVPRPARLVAIFTTLPIHDPIRVAIIYLGLTGVQ